MHILVIVVHFTDRNWISESLKLIRLTFPPTEAAIRRCPKKFCIIHRKTAVLESFFNFIKKRLQHRVYTCEYFDVFKNSRFHRTPLVAASAPNCGNLTLLREINPYSYLSPDDFSLLMLLNIVFVQKTSSRRFSRKTISW